MMIKFALIAMVMVVMVGTAHAQQFFLITDRGNLIPLMPPPPLPPDQVGLTPFLMVEGPPDAMIVASQLNQYLPDRHHFREASAGFNNISASIRIITPEAWAAGTTYTFRGQPIGDLRTNGNELHGKPNTVSIYGFDNLFAADYRIEPFASGHAASTGPTIRVQNDSNNEHYLSIASDGSGRTILETDIIRFTADADRTVTVHMYRDCTRDCDNRITIGMPATTSRSIQLDDVVLNSGWEYYNMILGTAGSPHVTTTQGPADDNTFPYEGGGNSMTGTFYLNVKQLPGGGDIRPALPLMLPGSAARDISYDEKWTNHGRLAIINGSKATVDYLYGGVTETHYQSKFDYDFTDTRPGPPDVSCIITEKFDGRTTSTWPGPCTDYPGQCSGGNRAFYDCRESTTPTTEYFTNTATTGLVWHSPRNTVCSSLIQLDSYCSSHASANSRTVHTGTCIADCTTTVPSCHQLTAPSSATCVDDDVTVEAFVRSIGSEFGFRVTANACPNAGHGTPASGTFPNYYSCTDSTLDAKYYNINITMTEQARQLMDPMDVPPGYSTYTIQHPVDAPAHIVVDCYTERCYDESIYAFVTEDTAAGTAEWMPFEIWAQMPSMSGGNTAILHDDNRHYAAWNAHSTFEINDYDYQVMGLDGDMLMAGAPSIDGARGKPSLNPRNPYEAGGYAKLISHAHELIEEPSSSRIFPDDTELSIRVVDAEIVNIGTVMDMKNGRNQGDPHVWLGIDDHNYFGFQRLYMAVPFEEHTIVKNVVTVAEFDQNWLGDLTYVAGGGNIQINPSDMRDNIYWKAQVGMHLEGIPHVAFGGTGTSSSDEGRTSYPDTQYAPNSIEKYGPVTYGPDSSLGSIMYVPILPGAEWVVFQADDEWRWYKIASLGQPDSGYSQGNQRVTIIDSEFHEDAADQGKTEFREDETLLAGKVVATRDGEAVVDVLTSMSASWSSAVISQNDRDTAFAIDKLALADGCIVDEEIGAMWRTTSVCDDEFQDIEDHYTEIMNILRGNTLEDTDDASTKYKVALPRTVTDMKAAGMDKKMKIAADSHWHADGNFAIEPYIAVMTGSDTNCSDSTVFCEKLPLMFAPWSNINQIEGRFKIDDKENLMHGNATGVGFSPDLFDPLDPVNTFHDDGGQTRRYGVASYTIPDGIAVATLVIPGVETGDTLTIELRANIHVPSSDGRYRGDIITSERIIVDMHVSTFSVTVR